MLSIVSPGRATAAAPIVASIVLLLCLAGVVRGLWWIATSAAAIRTADVVGMVLLVWGGASAAGVLARRSWAHWAHWSFGLWAIITGLIWCFRVIYFGPLVLVVLVLARWAVGSEPRSQGPGAVTELRSR